MPRQIRNLLPRLDIVKSDRARIARSRKQGRTRGESDATNRLYEASERMSKTTGIVVEDVNRAVLVARSSEAAVPAEIDAHSETAFRLVLADLGLVFFVEAPDVDLAVEAAGGEVLAICAEGNGPCITGFELVWGASAESSENERVWSL